jgi:hypothetical protein
MELVNKVQELGTFIYENLMSKPTFGMPENLIEIKKKANLLKDAIIMHNEIVECANSNQDSFDESDRRLLEKYSMKLIMGKRLVLVKLDPNDPENPSWITKEVADEINSIEIPELPEILALK